MCFFCALQNDENNHDRSFSNHPESQSHRVLKPLLLLALSKTSEFQGKRHAYFYLSLVDPAIRKPSLDLTEL